MVVEAWPEGPGAWRVEAVGYDAFQFLSTVCTLLAIHGLEIVEGQAFTSDPRAAPSHPSPRRWRRPGRPPAPSPVRDPDRRPRIVDRFLVRRGGEAEGVPDWDAFQDELTVLVRLLRTDRFDEVHHRLIPRFVAVMGHDRPGAAALEAIDLDIDPAGEAFATRVRVGARDSFGFLSLTASALALCGVRIVQADVRTRDGRVDDTFWVTDRFGRRIEAEPRLRELRLSLTLIEHYSSYLPHATNPEAALVHFSRFAAETMARPDWGQEYAALDRPEVLDALVRVLGESDFLWEDYLHAQPENLLPMICDPDQWRCGRTPVDLADDRDAAMAMAPAPEGKAQALRRFRDREFFRAGVRAILGLSGGPEGFSAELSDVAEALLEGADRITRDELAPILPRRADRLPAPRRCWRLGKCGGRELGFGSDLELMLVYDDRDLAEVVGTAAAGAAFDRFVTTLRQAARRPRGGDVRPRLPAPSVREGRVAGHGDLGVRRVLPGRRTRLGLRTAGADQAPRRRGRPRVGARGRGAPRSVRLRARAVRPGRLPSAPTAPGRAARPARDGERQVQPRGAGRRGILRPGPPDRPRRERSDRADAQHRAGDRRARRPPAGWHPGTPSCCVPAIASSGR